MRGEASNKATVPFFISCFSCTCESASERVKQRGKRSEVPWRDEEVEGGYEEGPYELEEVSYQ